MKRVPRPYQAKALEMIRTSFRGGKKRVVLVSPTGSGKTFMASCIIDGAVEKGNRVLFVAHRKELIQQCSATLDNINVPHGVIKAGHPRKMPECPVQVASVQTLVSKKKCPLCKGDEAGKSACVVCKGEGRIRKHMPDAKIIVIDECHRSMSPTYQEVFDSYPDALVLGLTATPWRLDRKGLGRMYDSMVFTRSVKELIEDGHLLPLRYFAPPGPDLDGIETSGGDFKQSSLGEVMGDEKLIGDIVDHWKKHGEDRKTVLFASTVENSQDLARRFREDGIPSEHLDGDMDDKSREAVLERLSTGKTRVVCNVDVLVEGYDLPSLGCVILARPTKSLTRYLQQVGRVMRPEPGQSYAVVLDHAGCKYIHGMPEDQREWSLEDRSRDSEAVTKKEEQGFLDGLFQCNICGTGLPRENSPCPRCVGVQKSVFLGIIPEGQGDLVQVGTDVRCQKCGSESVTSEAHDDMQVKLTCGACKKVSFIVDRFAASHATEDKRKMTLTRLRHVRQIKGFKPGWERFRYKDIFGENPPAGW